MEGPGFVTVKYGENEEGIFNTWCPSHMLLKFILKKCFNEEDRIKFANLRLELVDMEGRLRDLQVHPQVYANRLIDPRQTYILIKIERKEEGEEDKYTSLLHNIGRLYPNVKAKLDELSHYKVSGKVGSRWMKIKTVSKFSAMGSKNSSRSSKTPLERKISANSIESARSARTDKSSGRKTPVKTESANKKKKKD